MGDLLRRVLYPLFLPAIVVTVWAHAWSAKVDAARTAFPAGPPQPHRITQPATPEQRWVPAYGLSKDDGFASTADGDRDEGGE
jgi:hypothetical protein